MWQTQALQGKRVPLSYPSRRVLCMTVCADFAPLFQHVEFLYLTQGSTTFANIISWPGENFMFYVIF